MARQTQAVANLLLAAEITFDLLWTLLPPNELMYALDGFEQKRIYRAVNNEYKQEQDGTMSLEVKCSFFDHDGKRIGRAGEPRLMSRNV
jgi:hypothetical protein